MTLLQSKGLLRSADAIKFISGKTYAEVKAIALLAPTVQFDCYTTDTGLRMFYTANVAEGDVGFITL